MRRERRERRGRERREYEQKELEKVSIEPTALRIALVPLSKKGYIYIYMKNKDERGRKRRKRRKKRRLLSRILYEESKQSKIDVLMGAVRLVVKSCEWQSRQEREICE